MELSNIINKYMIDFINVYSEKISDEFFEGDIDKKNVILNMGIKLINNPQKKIENENITENVKENGNNMTCLHKWTRGNHIIGSLCGAKTFEGIPYCKTHKNDINKIQSIIQPTKINNITKSITQTKKQNKNLVIIKHPRIKKFWHPETRLIFDIIENKKIVTEKLSEDNRIICLDEEDVEICKTYGFLYKQNGEITTITTDEENREENIEENREDNKSLIIIEENDNKNALTPIDIKDRDITNILQEIKENNLLI